MKKSVLIGMPILQKMIDIDVAESIFSLLQMPSSFDIFWRHQKGAYIDRNLCWLVEEAKKLGVSHFLQVDSDLVFPLFTITALMEHEKLVVGASYNYKTLNMPGQPQGACPMVRVFGKDGEAIISPTNTLPHELFKTPLHPGGLMLVDMKVFEMIEKPYFESKWDVDGITYVGEDFYFCEKVRKAGIDVWCDPNIPVHHIGPYLY